jgi:dolichyl-phosphate beta-glucosyltransferase
VNAYFVSVIIPTYNEGGCIQSNLEKVVDYLSPISSQSEVIVVDDGSTDDTLKQVALAAHQDPRIRLIPFSTNRGKGFAVKQGILAARGDAVFFTDADLSTSIEAIQAGLNGIAEGCPVVIASRRHPESVIALPQNRARDAIGRLFNLVVRTLLSLRFRDTQCGFKCFSREAAREIFSLARIDGYAFDVEIIIIARKLGYRIKEIPVCWSDSADSKVRPLGDLSRVTRDLLKIYRNERAGLYSLPE